MSVAPVDTLNVYHYTPVFDLSFGFDTPVQNNDNYSTYTYTPVFGFGYSNSSNLYDFYYSLSDYANPVIREFSVQQPDFNTYLYNFSTDLTPTLSSYTPSLPSGNFNLVTSNHARNNNTNNLSNTGRVNAPVVSSQVQNAQFWESLGYNAQKGQRLAQEARNGIASRFTGNCAKYTKNAIQRAGLGNYQYGVHGCDMARAYSNNGNFKVISAQGIDVKTLPAGCILVYGAGVSGHHRQYGHTGVSLGNGTEASDYITYHPKPCSYILIPV